jgi:hypothetical protein
MRSTLLVLVLGGVMATTACGAPAVPADPCAPARGSLNGAKAAQAMATQQEMEASLKVLSVQGDAFNASMAVSKATGDLAGAELNGDPDAATAARIDKELADAKAKAATADAVVKAAQAEETKAKAAHDASNKDVADAQAKLDACAQAHR